MHLSVHIGRGDCVAVACVRVFDAQLESRAREPNSASAGALYNAPTDRLAARQITLPEKRRKTCERSFVAGSEQSRGGGGGGGGGGKGY